MKARVDEEIVRYLWWLRPIQGDETGAPIPVPVPRRPEPRRPLTMNHPQAEALNPAFAAPSRPTAAAVPSQAARAPQPARVGGDDAELKTVRRDEPKVGRNDPCPCGSGKKYKKCHMPIDEGVEA